MFLTNLHRNHIYWISHQNIEAMLMSVFPWPSQVMGQANPNPNHHPSKIYSPEIQHGYPKWCFGKGKSLQKWQFWVSILVFGSVDFGLSWLPSGERSHILPLEKENHRPKIAFAGDMLVSICVVFTPPKTNESKNDGTGKWSFPFWINPCLGQKSLVFRGVILVFEKSIRLRTPFPFLENLQQITSQDAATQNPLQWCTSIESRKKKPYFPLYWLVTRDP